MKRSIPLFLLTVALGSCLLIGPAWAFNEADLQKLKSTNKCVNCDLSGADLTQLKALSGADLSNANLVGANLDGRLQMHDRVARKMQ
jgi:uncharacterized protein YjbI with pentapeptide repeats